MLIFYGPWVEGQAGMLELDGRPSACTLNKRLTTHSVVAVWQGEVQMAAALALVTKAASEAEMTHARALLQQAKDCFERAGAPPQLFEELTSMLQQVVEAETLLRRKAEIEQQVSPPAARARALPVAVCTLSRACARLDAYQEGVHQYGIGCRL